MIGSGNTRCPCLRGAAAGCQPCRSAQGVVAAAGVACSDAAGESSTLATGSEARQLFNDGIAIGAAFAAGVVAVGGAGAVVVPAVALFVPPPWG